MQPTPQYIHNRTETAAFAAPLSSILQAPFSTHPYLVSAAHIPVPARRVGVLACRALRKGADAYITYSPPRPHAWGHADEPQVSKVAYAKLDGNFPRNPIS